MYLDAAYIVKLYVDEPESDALQELVLRADRLSSSALSIAEVHCVFLRDLRDGKVSSERCSALVAQFSGHLETGVWTMAPVSENILRRTSTLPLFAPRMILRAGDAIHLLTAQQLGEREVWTNDRHMLAAAPYFGLVGRSV